jgi:hypothetical protein
MSARLPRGTAGVVLMAALAGGSGVLGVGCIAYARHGLAHHLRSIRTEEQVDCGSLKVLIGSRLEVEAPAIPAVSGCLEAARRAGRPFIFSVEGPGIDSYLATGLVADARGRVQRFWYDSAPCGGPYCAERFSLWPCPMPTAPGGLDPNMDCPLPKRAVGTKRHAHEQEKAH